MLFVGLTALVLVGLVYAARVWPGPSGVAISGTALPAERPAARATSQPPQVTPVRRAVATRRPAPTPTPELDLVMLSHSGGRDGRYMTIVGEVRNDTDRAARFVKVVATYYDSAGSVVETDFTYVQSANATLAPGQRAAFKISTLTQPNADRYVLDVQGRP